MSDNVIPMFGGDQSVPPADELNWAFPDVPSGQSPFGGRVIVQLRRIKKKAGMIIIVDETKESEKWNNMIGKVVAIGPLAFKNRDTMVPWPEGSWRRLVTTSESPSGVETVGNALFLMTKIQFCL